MKSKNCLLVLATAIFGAFMHPTAGAADEKPLAPYFLVKGEQQGVDQLPLKSTDVQANIAGVIADVKVTQVYRNTGQVPLEARYIFPGSTGAAVYGMTMHIGERTIFAEIREKGQARKEYDAAKQAGKTASLLEQHRPNVFEMNVANILPGDEVKVELNYTELLQATERIYEFIFPGVVGPRYSNQGAESSPPDERWVANPYLHAGVEGESAFNIAVNLEGGMAINDIASTSHDIEIEYHSPQSAHVALGHSTPSNGNRDYVLHYRLAGEEVQTGLLLYQGENENYFLALLEPPFRPQPDQIPAREYIFVVDVSGSMTGFPLDTTKQLLQNLLRSLRPTDSFNIVLFAGGSSVLAPSSLPASSANIETALQLLAEQTGGGATELVPALERALALPAEVGRSRSIVVVTDGYISAETDTYDLIKANLNRANLFSFGIGSSVNRYLIEGMAHLGQGEPFIVTKPSEAAPIHAQFQKYISSPLLTGAAIAFEKFKATEVIPQSIPDVMAERPVAIFGKWQGAVDGTIKLSGMTGKGRFEKVIDVGEYRPLPANTALKYLWARHQVQELSDYNALSTSEELKQRIIQIGLKYNLLTQYTSFIAVDKIIRRDPAVPMIGVKQPLPLPQGVSDNAVGGEIPSTPEPETWALIMTLMLTLSVVYLRREQLWS